MDARRSTGLAADSLQLDRRLGTLVAQGKLGARRRSADADPSAKEPPEPAPV